MLWIQVSIMACGLAAIFLVLRIEYSAGFSISSSQWFVEYGKLFLKFFYEISSVCFAIVVGFYLWWRGIALARSELYFNDIYDSFLVYLVDISVLNCYMGFYF